MIPNGDNITARAHYNLRLQNVSAQASEADILPSFKHSLLLVGQLCDDDCTAIFSKHHCTIYNKYQEPVINGIRNHSTGLYEQCLPENNNQTNRQANATLPTKNLEEHIKYLHQCAFSPTPRTWMQAVRKGHFRTWPGVTVQAIKRYLPKSEATTMGHLDQQRKTYNPQKSSKTTEKPWLHRRHLTMDVTHMPCMRQPSATMNPQENYTPILLGDSQFRAAEDTNIYSSPIISIPTLYMSNHSKVDMITTP